jgi:hypothetical protein
LRIVYPSVAGSNPARLASHKCLFSWSGDSAAPKQQRALIETEKRHQQVNSWGVAQW